MKNKISLLFCLIIGCVHHSNLSYYESDKNIFNFSYPSEWNVSEINELTVMCKSAETRYYPARFSLIVQLMPSIINLNEYKEISINQMKSLYLDLKLLKIDTTIFINKKAMLMEMEYTNKGNKLRGISVYCVEGKMAFIFSGIALKSKWENNSDVFNKVMNSTNINKIQNIKT